MVQRGRENEAPQSDPLAYFLTWPTYGTWLPGDERGWVEYRRGWQLPDPVKKLEAEARMTEGACVLDGEQRQLVETTVRQHCQIRGWTLHAVNCRTNHLHVVVTANCHPDVIREQLKAWSTRKLKDLDRSRQNMNPTRQRGLSHADAPASSPNPPTRQRDPQPTNPKRKRGTPGHPPRVRENWWAECGSKRYINDDAGIEAAILYVRDAQDHPH